MECWNGSELGVPYVDVFFSLKSIFTSSPRLAPHPHPPAANVTLSTVSFLCVCVCVSAYTQRYERHFRQRCRVEWPYLPLFTFSFLGLVSLSCGEGTSACNDSDFGTR